MHASAHNIHLPRIPVGIVSEIEKYIFCKNAFTEAVAVASRPWVPTTPPN